MLIRADAGPEVGAGHLMRCIALGQVWKRMGGKVVIGCGRLPNALLQRLNDEGFDTFVLNDARNAFHDAKNTSELVSVIEPSWVVLDGYRFDEAYQSMLAAGKSKLLCIDDLASDAMSYASICRRAAVVLNQNVGAKVNKPARNNHGTEFLLGPKYALLRREFTRSQTNRKMAPAVGRRILITFGGSDAAGMTERVLAILEKTSIPDSQVDVVFGPLCVTNRARQSTRHHVTVFRNLDSMSSLMEQADVAISAGGSTCYELARCGVPIVVIPVAANQLSVARGLEFHGVSAVVEKGWSDQQIEKTLQRIIFDSRIRQSMSNAGQRLIDGQGAGRVARRLFAKLFQFRPARLSDARLLLDWRNDPETRSVSFRSDLIDWDTHVNWLQARLASGRSHIHVIEDPDCRPIGQIRFERDSTEGQTQMSIFLTSSARGRGLGTAFIEQACHDFRLTHPNLEIVAQIKPTNVASQTAFRKAGFVPKSSTTVNGQIAMQFVLAATDEIVWTHEREPEQSFAVPMVALLCDEHGICN
jgi:UDP-2,4-diacetamido-2,4,6-trideoxy-beta-L-altropyranose hydrolase